MLILGINPEKIFKVMSDSILGKNAEEVHEKIYKITEFIQFYEKSLKTVLAELVKEIPSRMPFSL